jgi:Zn-finger domain-containing protein
LFIKCHSNFPSDSFGKLWTTQIIQERKRNSSSHLQETKETRKESNTHILAASITSAIAEHREAIAMGTKDGDLEAQITNIIRE